MIKIIYFIQFSIIKKKIANLLTHNKEVIFIICDSFSNQSAWLWIPAWHQVISAAIKFRIHALVHNDVSNFWLSTSILDCGFQGFSFNFLHSFLLWGWYSIPENDDILWIKPIFRLKLLYSTKKSGAQKCSKFQSWIILLNH